MKDQRTALRGRPCLWWAMGLMMLAVTVARAQQPAPAAKETRLFELRTYVVQADQLDPLLAHFRQRTGRLFGKHGMTPVGYWTAADFTDRLVQLLAYPSAEAREAAWKALVADPDWKAAAQTLEEGGTRIARIESVLLRPTDYSPAIAPAVSAEPRVFELRHYTATPGKRPDLLARFRSFALPQFAKHGMMQIAYWTPEGQEDDYYYILAHKSYEAWAASWRSFRSDPYWVKVKKGTEEKAGGSLTVPDGVRFQLLLPTDFSPMK